MKSAIFRHEKQRYRVDVEGDLYTIWFLIGRSGAGKEVTYGAARGRKLMDYAGDPPNVTPELIDAAQKALDAT